VSGTWGAPILPTGLDQFTKPLQPRPRPVDALSEFVLDRIDFAERQPAGDMVPKLYNQPAGAMAHRYAAGVRRDMVAFRRIVQMYCECSTSQQVSAAAIAAYRVAVKAIAMRFADHPDFRDEWRLE
jgi:hypothetical protein